MTLMQQVLPERVYAQVMMIDPQRLDRHLPEWARRAHPVVRRQLGIFWRAITPDLLIPARLYVIQVAFVIITFVIPGLFNLLLPVVTVPVVLLPAVIYFYIETLVRIGAEAAASVADARASGRLELLRTTPLTLRDILSAHGAAAIWRQIEMLEVLLIGAALLSLPLVILQHVNLYPPLVYPIAVRFLMITGFAASLLRVLVEPLMIAAIGVLMGASTQARIPSMLATVALGIAYVVLINLPRLLPLDPAARFIVEMILPLVLPLLITWGALRLATWRIEKD
jgi:hypothetical protein